MNDTRVERQRRLFIALTPTADLRVACRVAMDELERWMRHIGKAREARWVAADNLHVTVRFIGDVAVDRARALERALELPIDFPPFDVEIAGAGLFPPSGAARVLWFGLRGAATGLAALHQEIERRVASAGFDAGTRPFSPHLTVARLRDGSRWPVPLRDELRQRVGVLGSWHIDHVTLYESRLPSSGPTYLPLARTPLAGAPSAEHRTTDTLP